MFKQDCRYHINATRCGVVALITASLHFFFLLLSSLWRDTANGTTRPRQVERAFRLSHSRGKHALKSVAEIGRKEIIFGRQEYSNVSWGGKLVNSICLTKDSPIKDGSGAFTQSGSAFFVGSCVRQLWRCPASPFAYLTLWMDAPLEHHYLTSVITRYGLYVEYTLPPPVACLV